jgi:hypothetical protein
VARQADGIIDPPQLYFDRNVTEHATADHRPEWQALIQQQQQHRKAHFAAEKTRLRAVVT